MIGSTRFWNLEHWSWPGGHALHGRTAPDVCEIGYTWLTRSAVRTAANTEAKLLMLTHAFEAWHVLRVCFHTDYRNARSRAALERIGGQFEGILRAHRMAADYIPRDSVRYSILMAEWPAVKQRLVDLMDQGSRKDAKQCLQAQLASAALLEGTDFLHQLVHSSLVRKGVQDVCLEPDSSTVRWQRQAQVASCRRCRCRSLTRESPTSLTLEPDFGRKHMMLYPSRR